MTRVRNAGLLCVGVAVLMVVTSGHTQDGRGPLFENHGIGAGVDLRPEGPVPGQYIVVFRRDVASARDLAREMSRRNRFPLRQTFSHALKGFSGRMPARLAQRLRLDPDVAFVEQDVYASTAVQTLPTGVDRIEADMSVHAADPVDVDVAVIDTGVAAHSDLNVVQWVNFTSEASSADRNGHGTHVAGTVAARDNGIGVVGVAPGARIHSVKVLDARGNGTFSDVIEGIDWVTANADVIEVANLSLGGVGYLASLRQAIQSSVEAGVVFVAAAGNSSTDVYGANGRLETSAPSHFCRFYDTCADDAIPAAYPEVASISALADADGQAGGVGAGTGAGPDDSLASFSNYSTAVVDGNPVSSPGLAIDLAAPGVNIDSTWLADGYRGINGTSMAAPHVTGAVALYIAENGRASDATDVYAIRQALIDSAQPQSDWRDGAATNDPDGNREGLVMVADSGGGGEVSPSNSAPAVTITSPADNAVFRQGDPISFAATAIDEEDGEITSSLEWTSDRDGPIAGGSGFSTTDLSVNTHTITATATDSGNMAGAAAVEISVISADEPVDEAIAVVDSVSYRTQGSWRWRNLLVTVSLVDGLGEAVSDAPVSIDLSREGSVVASGNGDTGGDGSVTFRLRGAQPGNYSTTVTSVDAEGLTWDGETPPNQFGL